jgi:hypothetical protein
MDVMARSVGLHADERALTYGEVVWSWRLGAGAKLAKMLTDFASDGGKKADPRGATVLIWTGDRPASRLARRRAPAFGG